MFAATMAEGMLQKGVLIADRYELVSSLGGGGFGEVWRAQDRRFGRAVAVKFMRAELARDPNLRRRFAREARSLAAIRHPNVVDVYDDGEWSDRPFVVLQLVEGSTLREWMEGYQKIRKLPPAEEVRALFAQVCDGVGAAHAQGIVHRDLKPENVLISFDAEGRATAKVLDFGLARGGTLQTSTGLQGGTIQYMSPEQATEGVDAAGPASDVFSLAVMLVELLTRRLLPESPKQTTWWNAAQLGRAAAAVGEASRVRGDVPSAVWSVVAAALATEAERRPATAGALRRALEGAWAGAASVSGAVVGGSAGAVATAAAVGPMASVVAMPSMVIGQQPSLAMPPSPPQSPVFPAVAPVSTPPMPHHTSPHEPRPPQRKGRMVMGLILGGVATYVSICLFGLTLGPKHGETPPASASVPEPPLPPPADGDGVAGEAVGPTPAPLTEVTARSAAPAPATVVPAPAPVPSLPTAASATPERQLPVRRTEASRDHALSASEARMRTSEATANISRIYQAEITHYNQTAETDYPRFMAAPRTPSSAPTALPYAANVDRWRANPAWSALGFEVVSTHYYQYRVVVHGANEGFTITAIGDLDGDGVFSTFQRSAVVRDGEIQGSSLRIVHELE